MEFNERTNRVPRSGEEEDRMRPAKAVRTIDRKALMIAGSATLMRDFDDTGWKTLFVDLECDEELVDDVQLILKREPYCDSFRNGRTDDGQIKLKVVFWKPQEKETPAFATFLKDQTMNVTTVITVHGTPKSERAGGLDAGEVSQFTIAPGEYDVSV
jgi:hypothetical protein